VVPAFLSLLLILFTVHEPERPPGLRQGKNRSAGRSWAGSVAPTGGSSPSLQCSRWRASARPSCCSVGLAVALVPAMLVLMNLVYALSAYPADVLSDRIDRSTVPVIGLVLLVAADVTLSVPGTHRKSRRCHRLLIWLKAAITPLPACDLNGAKYVALVCLYRRRASVTSRAHSGRGRAPVFAAPSREIPYWAFWSEGRNVDKAIRPR
jgi:hypothetical protein